MRGQTPLFSFRLQNAQRKEISRLAKRECRTQASVVRQAIIEFLEREKK